MIAVALAVGLSLAASAPIRAARGDDKATRVDWAGAWIGDGDLAPLGRRAELRAIDLSHTRITDLGLRHLRELKNVETLRLYFAEQVSDEGLQNIKGWSGLARIDLRGTKITDTTLAVLGSLPALAEIDVGFARVTDGGIGFLSRLVNLRALHIGGNRITNQGLQSLRALSGLRSLNLSGQQRTDSGLWRVTLDSEGMEAVASLRQLRVLNLAGLPVGNAQVKTLAALGELERLDLHGCARVTDEALAILAAFPALKWIDLAGTAAKPAAVAALREKRPGVEVLFED